MELKWLVSRILKMGSFRNLITNLIKHYQDWKIVREASQYSICNVNINCSSCLWCSKKEKYCSNENIFKQILSNEQYELGQMMGHHSKKIRLTFAIRYCKLKQWSFSPDIKRINGRLYCFVYWKYNYSGVGWRECRFWFGEKRIEDPLNIKEVLK